MLVIIVVAVIFLLKFRRSRKDPRDGKPRFWTGFSFSFQELTFVQLVFQKPKSPKSKCNLYVSFMVECSSCYEYSVASYLYVCVERERNYCDVSNLSKSPSRLPPSSSIFSLVRSFSCFHHHHHRHLKICSFFISFHFTIIIIFIVRISQTKGIKIKVHRVISNSIWTLEESIRILRLAAVLAVSRPKEKLRQIPIALVQSK